MRIKYVLEASFILQVVTGISCYGQSITGEWIGIVEKNAIFCKNPTLYLTLKQSNNGNVTGYLIYNYGKQEYEQFAVSGIFDLAKRNVVLIEDTLVESTFIDAISNSAIGKLFLRFQDPDSLTLLKGKWSDKTDNFVKANSFAVSFKKVNETFPAITERRNDIRDSILLRYYPEDSIRIQIFDNGVIDNDTISLYLNETCLLFKQRISFIPVSVAFTMAYKSDELLLKLVAENYGDIPPNTAAIRIIANKNNYLFNVLSTKWINGSILIRISQ
jgi:hypothetical protein